MGKLPALCEFVEKSPFFFSFFFLKFEESLESSGTSGIIISGLQVKSTLLPVYKGKEVILVMQ